jgi:hypothetical protein
MVAMVTGSLKACRFVSKIFAAMEKIFAAMAKTRTAYVNLWRETTS